MSDFEFFTVESLNFKYEKIMLNVIIIVDKVCINIYASFEN